MLRVLVMLLATAAPVLAAEGPVCIEDATIVDLQKALAAGTVTATDLTRAYIARIEAYDRAGPSLNAVRELNPDALKIAEGLDAAKPAQRRPLEGIPILLKDNIATGDAEHTTAGSLALADAQAQRDAFLVKRLRDAGAVILGKTNLTEFANILAIDMPAGYSSLGGQVRNPYVPQLDEKGIPIVTPGGSSSGSAVAVAAGFAAAAIGTETSGSLLSPASQNGVVTVKPTVGLISRSGIIPIAHSQDTAGPLTRTVRDAALLLNVLAAPDPEDEATRDLQRPADYTAVLDKDGLRGARIGIPSDPSDPANDVIYGQLAPRFGVIMENAIAALEAAGAVLVRANLPTIAWMGGPGTEAPILNRNPESRTFDQVEHRPVIYLYELKHDLNAYLRDWAKGTKMKHDVRHHRLQQSQCEPRAAFRPGHLPRLRRDARRLERDGISRRAADGHSRDAYARPRRLHGRQQARRRVVSGPLRLEHPGEGRLSERAGAWRHGARPRRQAAAGLSVRRDLYRPRLERAGAAAPRLRLRAGDQGAPPASGHACAHDRVRGAAQRANDGVSAAPSPRGQGEGRGGSG